MYKRATCKHCGQTIVTDTEQPPERWRHEESGFWTCNEEDAYLPSRAGHATAEPDPERPIEIA